ncbi:hypothetical protein [Hufsiella ginkgonis]|uniref:Uncharacterized protein n=1 Tax=Hufsiella ginkgonis TaxID=2695274 RepID=A0A7K1XT48_9SPHI|nr:hypothetical protein [Hufsiella ginkgonis]MXV14171.1 hypothetical protein [Hufsiella ginkgonis]
MARLRVARASGDFVLSPPAGGLPLCSASGPEAIRLHLAIRAGPAPLHVPQSPSYLGLLLRHPGSARRPACRKILPLVMILVQTNCSKALRGSASLAGRITASSEAGTLRPSNPAVRRRAPEVLLRR